MLCFTKHSLINITKKKASFDIHKSLLYFPFPKVTTRYSLNKFNMLSQAGRQYERSKRIKPLEKSQRERVYKSVIVKVDKPVGEKKFSPFNTVDRTSRDSYLLRVTKEPNVDDKYQPKLDFTLPLDRRATIDKAKFKRIIGLVKDEDYSVDPSNFSSRCHRSQEGAAHRPLTVRETHNWRKTFEHFDFKKQQDSKRLSLPRKLSEAESTREDFMLNLQTITESNFNNFKRFSFKSKPQKAHQFESDFGHEYLKDVQTRDKSPEYDVRDSDESIVHKSMSKTKGEKRFYLYREKIATRHDRADKQWHTFLDYDADPHKIKPRISQTITIDQTTDRRDNEVHSSYPIRLSLCRPRGT